MQRYTMARGALGALVALLLMVTPSDADASKKGKKKARDAEQPVPAEVAEVAEEAPRETVHIPCHYPVESVHRYTVETESTRRSPDTTTRRHYRTTTAVHVLSHELPLTTVDLKSESVEFLEIDDPTFALIAETLAKQPDAHPRMQFHHEDLTLTLVNVEAMVGAYGQVADAVIAAVSAQQPLPPEIAAGMRALITQPELIVNSTTIPWAPLFHFGCGSTPLGELPFESETPNPFGGPPLPSRGTVTITHEGPNFRFITRESVDVERASTMLAPLFERMGWMPRGRS